MKVLFLVMKEQRVFLDNYYGAIGKHCDLDIRWLDDNQQGSLRKYFAEHIDVKAYDRIMLFLRFKKVIRQTSFVKKIPNLVFLEHDACQNYADCKYKGVFSAYYRKMPWARILCSGVSVTRRLREEGFDAHFVAKGYDEKLLSNLGFERDIELGFVGSTKNKLYRQRKVFLERLAEDEELLVARTESGEEYLRALNRILFFVSADIGFDEYMIKNFEAMACGCVLFAYDQGEEENEALGFIDMVNVVLYQDIPSFKKKLSKLRCDPDLAARIARNGQTLVEENYTFSRLGHDVVAALQAPLRSTQEASIRQKLRSYFGI